MSFGIGGGSNVTVQSTTYGATSKKTASYIVTADIGGAGTTTIGTVGANKVWRILSVHATIQANSAAAEQYSRVLLNDVAVMALDVAGVAASIGNQALALHWDYSACPVLTAGQTVKFQVGTNCKSAAGFSYVEEDA